jgi:hypothetical protein
MQVGYNLRDGTSFFDKLRMTHFVSTPPCDVMVSLSNHVFDPNGILILHAPIAPIRPLNAFLHNQNVASIDASR